MKIKTNMQAGFELYKSGGSFNHNQTLVREAKKNLRVKTNVKAGTKVEIDS